MLDVLESSEEKSFDYFNVQNLSFDHPLTPCEIEDFKSIILSINTLQQIYFKGNIDVRSIEAIKNLLTMSGYVDDGKVEKYVVANLSSQDIDAILNSSYENPTTWQVAYSTEDNNYMLAELPKCRSFFSYIKRIKVLASKENLSPFEIVLRVYDIVKLLEYDNDSMSDNVDLLPDIIVEGKASSYGFNRLFSYILNELGIKTFVGKEKSADNKESFVTIAEISDEKYGIDGIYLFDPSMDSLPKDTYKSDDIRMINYNYFGLLLSDVDYSVYNDALSGALGILAIEDFDYSMERKKNVKDSSIEKEFESLNKIFGNNYKNFYNKIKTSQTITFDQIMGAIGNIYGENKSVPNYPELVKENYYSRKSELFNPKVDELLDGMLK